MYSGNLILVYRSGPSADKEIWIRLLQGDKNWSVDPAGEICRVTLACVSKNHTVNSFMDGLVDSGFQVIVHKNFNTRTQVAYEHKIEKNRMMKYASYLYGLAFGLGQWENVVTQLKRVRQRERIHVLLQTGKFYYEIPYLARVTGQICLK